MKLFSFQRDEFSTLNVASFNWQMSVFPQQDYPVPTLNYFQMHTLAMTKGVNIWLHTWKTHKSIPFGVFSMMPMHRLLWLISCNLHA
jgi:hypothetical protein